MKFEVARYGSGATKQLRLRYKNLSYVISSAVVFLGCFVLAFVAGSFVIVPQASNAVTGLVLAGSPSMTLAVDNNAITLSPVPNVNNGMASGLQVLTASTNVPTGYNLMLATANTPTLATTTGTIMYPTTLANNTWGYALANAGATGIMNDFDNSYNVPIPSPTSRWANPTINTTIKNTTTTATNDTTNIYYGAKVDMSLASGTYANTITYTATANIANITLPSILLITPTSGTTAGGTAIEITGNGFTHSDQSITTAVTIGGQNCSNVSISSNTPSLGLDRIYCTTPANTAGAKNVVVTTWGGTATGTSGFTYIAPASVTFVSPNVASTIAGTESGPALTIVGNGFSGTGMAAVSSVTVGGVACTSFTVASDTQIFCKAPNNINTTGNKAIVVNKGTVASTGAVNVTYNSTAYPTLQASNAFTQCTTTAKLFRDTRDSQLYYVKKMQDNKCWMVDNLKYANYGALVTSGHLTVDGTSTQTATNIDVAKFIDPGANGYCTGSANLPTNTNTRCGLQYNWYAATRGTGTYAHSTQGNQATGSICPANFRLPSLTSGTGGPTTNGTGYTVADLPVLNASMNAGSLVTGNTNSTYAGWQPGGAWGGAFAGLWLNTFGSMGSFGYYWSSTAYSTAGAHDLVFSSSVLDLGNNATKSYGLAVRCVMTNPAPSAPPGTEPMNVSSTNPAVLDVYPTTGWEGDTVAITSNALFTDVTDITIGGTACTEWGVITESLATCKIPPKTAGTTNNIVVMNNGTDIANASTRTHMKITYFNPSTTTVTINNTTYSFYPNGFTSANCTAMTPDNSAIGATPATALAYVRDIRNNQTYKVKKMVDNKCWMVDNLKYIDTNITNTADNTTGMTYNQGDHLGNGGTTAWNTIDESSTQSTTNSDKAFFNNPMSTANCYSSTYMPNNTLTHCGYLYNWYAATNGTGTYSQSTQGNNVTGNICPAGFRLPSAMSDGTTPTGNGTSYNAADFAVLNASMNAGTLTTGNTTSSYQAGWQPSGSWGGSFAGYWTNGLADQGGWGDFWSSTVYSATNARNLYFNSSVVYPGGSYTSKGVGVAVRCVLP